MYKIVKDTDITNEEWLNIATDKDREPLSRPHGNIASDGVMIFACGRNPSICNCGDIETHKKINNVIAKAKDMPFAFAIDITRLLEALSVISEDSNYVLFFTKDGKSPVVIQGESDYYTAVIMPMYPVDEKLNMPEIVEPELDQN